MQEHGRWAILPDPWEDGRIIDYWVWRDDRLVPATSDGHARVAEDERPRARSTHLRQCEITRPA